MDGGLSEITADLPLRTDTDRFDGGSGAINYEEREKNRHICINFRISINYHVLCGSDKAKFPINIKCASVIGNYHMQAK